MAITQQTPPIFTDARCCLFGDSFVAGIGDPTGQGWSGRLFAPLLAQGTPITVYNLGIRRESSRQIAQRYSQEARPRFAMGDWFGSLFSFGVNDTVILHSQPRLGQQESLSHAASLARRAAQFGAVSFIGPPPVDDPAQNSRIQALDAAMGQMLGAMQIPYCSVFAALVESAVWMDEVKKGDGSHPAAAGYGEMAQVIMEWPEWWFYQTEEPPHGET
uniref:SGNH hydrolase-type esterase domain-containing protein n=1 Tax=Magnetococcus massalia (strain MO-1) TaxID=451514 RepID=A0A1S7LC98_MAGMO|nr:Conserved protein of unknown function. Putative lipase. Putative hydrolase [Candidatus Magnetococcus massalia]